MAEELGRVRGKGGEGWRERRREVEEEREAEMELGEKWGGRREGGFAR